jgi:hypothetical protein
MGYSIYRLRACSNGNISSRRQKKVDRARIEREGERERERELEKEREQGRKEGRKKETLQLSSFAKTTSGENGLLPRRLNLRFLNQES